MVRPQVQEQLLGTRCLLFWPYLTHGQLLHLQLHLLAQCSRRYLAPRGTGRHRVAPMGRAATGSSPAGGLPAWSCPRAPLQTRRFLRPKPAYTSIRPSPACMRAAGHTLPTQPFSLGGPGELRAPPFLARRSLGTLRHALQDCG